MSAIAMEAILDQSAILAAVTGKPQTAQVIAGSLGAKLPPVLEELNALRGDGRIRRCVNGRAVAHWERGD
jgi:hypothetical protein